jgi:carbon monoxide dehydrogenase subunit G
MACACGKGGGSSAAATNRTYVHTDANGQKRTYRTEVEAAAAAKRMGGTYKSQ